MRLLDSYRNGNGIVKIYDDGTRIINFPGQSFEPDFPLNVDVRVSTKCSFGYNPKTGTKTCDFCHESARTDGRECDYDWLLEVLRSSQLPAGVELAIGCNRMTPGLEDFINASEWIVNLTLNVGHLSRDWVAIEKVISSGKVLGIGLSYREKFDSPYFDELVKLQNTVVHVIAGIDSFDSVIELANRGVKKILILGEKDFGFNVGKVRLSSESHVEWRERIKEMTKKFAVVSFDNLALEQLNVRRLLNDKEWNRFYQGEHSMYLNAVEKYCAPSSRSSVRDYEFRNVREYFEQRYF